jgi:arginyl-tRNA synthetase
MVVLGEDILNTGVEKIKNILQTRENFSEQQINETAETIGMAAIKYAFLNISSHSYLAFDLEKSISFEGDSGPYLQYAFARANKMLEAAKGYHRLSQAEMNLLDLNPEEIAVIKELRKFSDVMIEAGKHIEPSGICTYLFSLTQVFNQFYKKHQILKEADETKRSLRLMITEATAKTISEGLYYLGIKTVNEM